MLGTMRIKSLLIILLIFCCFACNKSKQQGLTIATAANCEFAIKKIVLAFEEETNISCNVIIGSSGKLSAQIHQGAPYDVFISADMNYPNYLYEQQLAANPPEIYAHGQLVLWTISKYDHPIEALQRGKFHKVALPNPKTAPYGKAAIEVLTALGSLDTLQPSLVYAESVSQANHFIGTESVDAAFTAYATIKHSNAPSYGQWTRIPITYHNTIEQGMIVLKGNNESQAEQFKSFILSTKGQMILKEFGYLLPH